MGNGEKRGPWWHFHLGYLVMYLLCACFGMFSFTAIATYGTGAAANIFGLLTFGLVLVGGVMFTGRQVLLALQGNPYK